MEINQKNKTKKKLKKENVLKINNLKKRFKQKLDAIEHTKTTVLYNCSIKTSTLEYTYEREEEKRTLTYI